MDAEQSQKQYLHALLTQKVKDQRVLQELEDQRELWSKRLQLAKDHGRGDLIKAAEERLAEIELSIPEIQGRIALDQREIDAARSDLSDAEIDGSRAMNRAQTEALVNQLQKASGTGEPDPLDFEAVKKAEQKAIEDEIAEIESDSELDALRKRLKEER